MKRETSVNHISGTVKKKKNITANRILLILLALTTFVACAREDVEVKNVVLAYNKMMTEALSKPDFKVMEYFTSTQELLRIEAYLTYLVKDKKLMVSEIKEIEFDDNIKIGKAKAVVKTKEQGMLRFIDEQSGKHITEETTRR